MQQRTIRNATTASGIGLHSGKTITLNILPAKENQGIMFVRTDLPGQPKIAAVVANLHHRMRCTSLVENGAEVHTTEHLMATCFAMGLDNLTIEIDGPEVPGMDGSALPFYELVKEAGIRDLDAKAKVKTIDIPIEVMEGKAKIIAQACSDGLRLEYCLDYDFPSLPKQQVCWTIDEETFAREIAPARTFALKSEVDALLKLGLGKGANTLNTLIIDDAGQIIENTPRFPDEPARHKLLDLLGDISLAACHIQGHIIAHRSGHTLNAQLTQKIVAQ